MKFEWDPSKAKINLAKHGISFEEALTIFENIYFEIMDESTDEERFKAIGISRLLKVLVVVYCHKENDITRIISARKASKNEEKRYQENC